MSIAALFPLTTLPTTALTCRHCGDACGDRPVFGDAGAFCCGGCAAVFTLLHREGLEAFYTCEVPPGVSQRRSAQSATASLAALEDPATAARFIEFTDGGEARAVFAVPGLHCASCLWLLERLWRIDAGIVRSDVDLIRRVVRVTYRADQISLKRVAECLTAVGYPPSLDADTAMPALPRERRQLYIRIGVAGFAFGNVMLFSLPRYLNGAPLDALYQTVFGGLNLALATLVLVVSASGYFTSALRAIRHRAMSLDIPIAIGLAALFLRTAVDVALGRGEGFADSFTGLVFFLLIGRLFQSQAFERLSFDRTFRSFLPLAACVLSPGTGRGVAVPIGRLRPGDRIVLRSGEIVPADAQLLDEAGTIDLSFVSGEDRPVAIARGAAVQAGARVVGRALQFELTTDVVHGRLATLWERARAVAPTPDALADLSRRFGLWFTIAALGLAAVGFVAWWPNVDAAIGVATAVLIIACPCALTLAAPLALGTAMTRLGERGVFLKTPGVALRMASLDTIVFDKTGTLTSTAHPSGAAAAMEPDAWALVECLAAQSVHPISRALAASSDPHATAGRVEACLETPGRGIAGRVDGHDVVIGDRAFVAARASGVSRAEGCGPAVAIDGRFAGWVPVSSVARPGLNQAAARLAATYRTLVLSGDQPVDLSLFEQAFGDRIWFGQSPEDKLRRVGDLRRDGHRVLMVGDGVNDAAALGAADVGMAVSDETACVVPACDVVIAGARLRDLPAILHFCRRTRQVVVACLVVSVLYNVLGLAFALAGALTPLAAAVLMPVSSLTIIGLSVGLTRLLAKGVPA